MQKLQQSQKIHIDASSKYVVDGIVTSAKGVAGKPFDDPAHAELASRLRAAEGVKLVGQKDDMLATLGEAGRRGALPKFARLPLGFNAIGDAGVAAFIEALKPTPQKHSRGASAGGGRRRRKRRRRVESSDEESEVAQKFCPKCGTKNDSGDPFCGNCGNKLVA